MVKGYKMKYCPKCQIETERKKSGKCIVCHKKYNAMWYLKNKDKSNKMSSDYRANNKVKVSESNKKYVENNKDKLFLLRQLYREKNKEKIANDKRQYRIDNPEKIKVLKSNRRAKILFNGGTLSKDLTIKLYKLQKGKCPCCNEPLGDDYHLDHIMPLALGGSNTDGNIQLLKSKCNHQKHALHPNDFMMKRGFLL